MYETGELPAHCDLLIVVGGDGSMLRIAKSAVKHQTPVIGVNRGRLGFLTDILPDELEAGVGEVLAGNYVVDERFLFDVYQDAPAGEGASGDNASGAGDSASSDNASDAVDSVLSDNASRDGDRGSSGNPDRAGRTWLSSALNDVVLHAGAAAQMIEFDLFVGADFVDSLIADGLIIATPTGSTAYALSAGGPIMHPDLDAIVLAPLNPHSLSSRPIVVAGNSEIRLVVADKSRRNASISCDGRMQHTADVCDRFLVRKKPRPLKLIHLQAHSFYESCRSKLGWGGSRKDEADD